MMAQTTNIAPLDLAPSGKPHPLLDGLPATPANRKPFLVEAADLDQGIPVMYRDFRDKVRIAYDPSQTTKALACNWVAARLHTTGTLADIAADAIRAAIRAEVDACPTTHPRVTVEWLHGVGDEESARHLAVVGEHSDGTALANERLSSATRAVEDALKYSTNRGQMVAALRYMLESVITEAGE